MSSNEPGLVRGCCCEEGSNVLLSIRSYQNGCLRPNRTFEDSEKRSVFAVEISEIPLPLAF